MKVAAFRVAPFVAGALVIMALTTALAQLTWSLMGQVSRHNAITSPSLALDSRPTAPADLDAILAFAPFGVPVSANLDAADTNAPAVTLTLEGILMAATPAQSQAVISAPNIPAASYSPGETLPGGAILIRIDASQVILRVAGRETILGFPLPAPAGANMAQRLLGQSPQAAASQTPIDDVIARARQRIAQNPKALLTELGVDAEAEGYRIGTAANGMTKRAGFKPGDIVTRVNGVAVGNVENDRRLFEDVVAAGRARVEILRNGHLTILTFPLR